MKMPTDYTIPKEEYRALIAENAKLRNARDVWQENDAKLRELVRHLYKCAFHNDCSTCEYVDDKCDFVNDMLELGMRVN